MARRSDHSREELLNLASDAVVDLVESHGFDGLTMRKVADRIGYSVGTLYNVFENLDHMVLTVNGATLDALDLALANTANSGDAGIDIHALLDAYLAFTETHPGRWAMLFQHSMRTGTAIPDWYQAKVTKVMGRLEQALAPLFAGNDQYDLTDAIEKRRSAQVLWASLHGIWSLAQTGKLGVVSREPIAVLARSLVENYVAGLRLRRAEGAPDHTGKAIQE